MLLGLFARCNLREIYDEGYTETYMQSMPKLLTDLMKHKEIDHNAAHLTWGNQLCHFTSSLMLIGMYALLFIGGLDHAAFLLLFAQVLRQSGHFFIEGNATHMEQAKIGYSTNDKIYTICLHASVGVVCASVDVGTSASYAQLCAISFGSMIVQKIIHIACRHSCYLALVWSLKIASDPFTDLRLYAPAMWGVAAGQTFVFTHNTHVKRE